MFKERTLQMTSGTSAFGGVRDMAGGNMGNCVHIVTGFSHGNRVGHFALERLRQSKPEDFPVGVHRETEAKSYGCTSSVVRGRMLFADCGGRASHCRIGERRTQIGWCS